MKTCTKCGETLPLSDFYCGKRGPISRCKPCQAEYAREWRAKRGDKYREWHREYREKNREKVNGYVEKFREKYPWKGAEYNQNSRKRNPRRAIYNSAKARAAKYGIEFSITEDDIEIPEVCPVFKTPFGPNTGRGQGAKRDSASLDRIVPSKGYVPGNVQVISMRANLMKSDSTKEQLYDFGKWLVENYKPSEE